MSDQNKPGEASTNTPGNASTNKGDKAARVAVCDQRKLFRQTLSLWLLSRPEFELVGSVATLTATAGICEGQTTDAVIVCVYDDMDALFLELRTLRPRFAGVRLIAVTQEAETNPRRYLDKGFHTVISARAGTAGLLRALESGSAIDIPEQTVPDPGPLTQRETEVLSLVGQGSTMEDISDQLGISPSTVASHKERIFDKLDANNQAHAVARALDLGIMTADEQPAETPSAQPA